MKRERCCLLLGIIVWSIVTHVSSGSKEVCRGEECPLECSCDVAQTVVDCSKAQLLAVPETLPRVTQTLLLPGNNISELTSGAFLACDRLTYLDLSRNNISLVSKGAFESLESLQVLLLFNNTIRPDELSEDAFAGLAGLKTLGMHYNRIPTRYNGALLAKGCPNLEDLSMDGLENSTFGVQFGYLTKLVNLTLYGNLTYVTNNTFRAFDGGPLRTLTIRSGQLADVEPLSFAHFKHLETLDLSFNPQLGFPNAAKSWYGLQFTNISSIILERAAPYDEEIIIIDNWFYNYLELTRLKRLVLDANNIVILDGHFHEYTPHLEYLSFAYNRLVQVYYLIQDLYMLNNLRHLDGSYQNKRLTRTSRSVGSPSRRGISPPCPGCLGRPRPVPGGPIYLDMPPNLEVVNLAGSLTLDYITMVPTYLIGTNHIRYMNYAENGIRKFLGPLVASPPPPQPFVFDLSRNGCEELGPAFTKYIGHKIGELRFSENRLGVQLAGDEAGTTFRNMTEMTALDLSFNEIRTLPESVFVNQDKLEHLNLSRNSLRVISFSFHHMTHLTMLDLSGNLLNELDGRTRQNLTFLATSTNLTVDLGGNPLEISCNTLPFLNWAVNAPHIGLNLKNWKAYKGMYKNSLASFSELEEVIIPKLRVDCASGMWLKVTGSVLAVVIVVIGVSIALYRYRFEVKYLCLTVIINRKAYEALQGEDKDADYEYSAFVAFDQQDLPFVQNQLQPILESRENGGLRLCIHHRDFASGPIEENILRALQNSRKIILLLTKHFVRSSWCRYELQMARLRCFDEGKDIIIPVVLGELPPRSMNRTLRALLRKNTYIEWPEPGNQQDVDNFWLKMRRALEVSPRRMVRCQCGRAMNAQSLL